MRLTWWETQQWYEYEEAYGDEPNTRAELLLGAPWQTRIVDLSLSEAELWRGVRRSYHSLINGLGRVFPCGDWAPSLGATGYTSCFYGTERQIGPMNEVRDIHRMEAGGDTRHSDTWKTMTEWLASENALLMLARRDLALGVGYAYFVVYDSWAYYFSAASCEPDLGLALIWWGMLALKARGVRWFEVGWQGEARDGKGAAIEFVRRGFGEHDVPARLSGRALTEGEYRGGVDTDGEEA